MTRAGKFQESFWWQIWIPRLRKKRANPLEPKGPRPALLHPVVFARARGVEVYLELRSLCFGFLSTFDCIVAHFGVSTTLFNVFVFQLFREVFGAPTMFSHLRAF